MEGPHARNIDSDGWDVARSRRNLGCLYSARRLKRKSPCDPQRVGSEQLSVPESYFGSAKLKRLAEGGRDGAGRPNDCVRALGVRLVVKVEGYLVQSSAGREFL